MVDLVKQVDKTSAQPDEVLTYTLNYANDTGQTVTNARIEDLIPIGATYEPGSASDGGTFDGSKVIWNLGSLDIGASGTVSFQVRIE